MERVKNKPGPKPKLREIDPKILELEKKSFELILERSKLIEENSKKVKELEEQIHKLELENVELKKKTNGDPMLDYQIMRGWGYPSVYTIRRF